MTLFINKVNGNTIKRTKSFNHFYTKDLFAKINFIYCLVLTTDLIVRAYLDQTNSDIITFFRLSDSTSIFFETRRTPSYNSGFNVLK